MKKKNINGFKKDFYNLKNNIKDDCLNICKKGVEIKEEDYLCIENCYQKFNSILPLVNNFYTKKGVLESN